MQGSRGRFALWGCLVAFAACGEIEDAKTEAREAIVQEIVLQNLDDNSSFEGTVENSPLGLDVYKGRVSVLSIGDDPYLGRKIMIKSGSSTLDLSPDSKNNLQGIGIEVYRWDGQQKIPIVNPDEAPDDDSAFAVVAYSEVRRDTLKKENNHDWYTYRTTQGFVDFNIVETGDDGGVKGSIEFDVLLLDPNHQPETLEELPNVSFKGKFNVRKSSASELYTGQ